MSIKNTAIKGVVCSVMSILAIVFGLDNNLRVSEKGLAHIANTEGCRSQSYQCSAERWSIGMGHAIGVKEGEMWDETRIAKTFIEDVRIAENTVRRLIEKTPTQGELDMMTSFVFNLGRGNFAKSTLLKKFNEGDNKEACSEYLRWVYVSGKDCRKPESNCQGIPARREIEARVCLIGWS